MSIWTDSDSEQRETFQSRPTVNQLLIAVAVLLASIIAAVAGGPGLGVLVATLAVLSAAIWIAYGGGSVGARAVPEAQELAAQPLRQSAVPAASSARTLPSVHMPKFTIDRESVTSLSFLAAAGSILSIVIAGAFVFLRDRDLVPPGLFADEAEIGVQSWNLLHGHASTSMIPFFYHHLEYDHVGTLPLFATAPFVGIFGLTEHALRGASAFWTILAAIVIYLTLRRLRVPYAVVPVLVTMVSPLVILIARTNFGHAPSLFAMGAGFLMWMIARQAERHYLALAAGIVIGISAYGQPSYYIAAPLLFLAIGVTEIAYNRLDWQAYRSVAWLALGAMLILLPVPYRALTYDPFLDRYRDKTEGAAHGIERLENLIKAYPDYFSYDMLFVRGTGGWQTRHTLVGAPWFFATVAIMLAVGLVSLVAVRGDASKRYFWPMALVLFLYPIPDVVSRPPGDPPYSFSLIWGAIAIPFVAGYGLIGVQRLAKKVTLTIPRPSLIYAGAILAATFISLFGFWRGSFANYPNVAADYWGWQFGARPIAEAFESHAGEYDQFLFSPDFNAAYVLEDFVMHGSDIADITTVGGLDKIDLTKRQLFAVRESSFDQSKGSQYPAQSYMKVIGTIDYPNGSTAFYLVTVDPALVQGPATNGETTTPAG